MKTDICVDFIVSFGFTLLLLHLLILKYHILHTLRFKFLLIIKHILLKCYSTENTDNYRYIIWSAKLFTINA